MRLYECVLCMGERLLYTGVPTGGFGAAVFGGVHKVFGEEGFARFRTRRQGKEQEKEKKKTKRRRKIRQGRGQEGRDTL